MRLVGVVSMGRRGERGEGRGERGEGRGEGKTRYSRWL